MCGVCGVIQVGGRPRPVVTQETLDLMTDAMVHRGPNDRGTYVSDGVALGVRRLSIVDVEGGHQPFSNEDGRIWGLQNGELYNHAAIRAELERDGHRFTSRCDTEILPHLYESDGDLFPRKLRGMFGLCVWDERERRAVIARDRLGIKPLYYAVVDDVVVFGSELKSVLLSGLVPTDLDFEAIDAYLTLGFVPGPMTPLAAVRKLIPGHVLIVERGGVRMERYWEYPRPHNAGANLTVEEQASELLQLLDESVRLRLMADVPLGAMLSGGLDSSLIVALMARNMTSPVQTFSVGFVEDGPDNELADAQFIAQALGARHHALELSYREASVDLAELVWHLDEPLADLSSLGFYALSKLASSHVTVALSGQGADELFGGYSKHRAATIAAAWRRVPRPLAAAGLAVARKGPHRLSRPVRTLEAADPVQRLLAMSSRVDSAMRAELYRGPLGSISGTAAENVVASLVEGVRDDPLPATLHIDGQLALVDDMLHYFDRASMAHSLEVRVPFLDHHVVEYAAGIPARHKVRHLRTKVVLKQAARGLVPDRIIDKRKLGFFASSTGGWLRSQVDGALKDYLLVDRPACAEFIDRSKMRQLVEAHLAGSDDNGSLLLALLMLEVWLSTALPRMTPIRAAAAPPEVEAA
jgi:asparagine synthase (glutamine-hydrolysing)